MLLRNVFRYFDYDDQEDAVWMSKILIDEECIVDNKGDLDELPF